MTPKALAAYLYSTYEQYRLTYLQPGTCKHEVIIPELNQIVAQGSGLFTFQEIGRSMEGRSITMVSFGRGAKRAFLWSQMHGDERTATLALMDIFNFLGQRAKEEEWVQDLLEQLTIYVVPMVNPDGAERVQRQTAAQIDMNRDARMLATPEARILSDVHRRLSPAFGFNLHDQPLYSVGPTAKVAALSLLAPALDEERSSPISRVRAMRVGALISCVLAPYIEGHIARYDDGFEPRAFGDMFQARGTSTLLIESGQWPNDPDKTFIRKLNFVALLTSLRSIGNGSYQDVEMDYYTLLKPNGKMLFDILIRGVVLESPGGWSHSADLGLLFTPLANGKHSRTVSIKEVGDLSGHHALETIEASGRKLSTSSVAIDQNVELHSLLDLLQLYHDKYSLI